MKALLLSSLTLPLVVACAALGEAHAPRASAQVTPAGAGQDPAPRSALTAEGEEAPSPTPLGRAELAAWNDPDFQRLFVESYAAETEVEPRVTVLEREHMQKVLEHMAENRPDRAFALLEKHRTPASSAVFDFTLANLHFQQERLDEAALAYRAAVEKYPRFRRAWRNLALIHIRRQEFSAASKAFTKVIEQGGGDALTYGLLGFAYSNDAYAMAAESAFRMAVLLDPEQLDWQLGLARSLFDQRRFADAAALCDHLIARHPERAELWLLQANAFLGIEEPLRAAQNLELVDRLGESTGASLAHLGDIYVNQELFDLALEAYLRSLQLSTDTDPERFLRAARVLAAHGASGEARALLAGLESSVGEGLGVTDRKKLLKLRARLAVAEGAGGEEARMLEEIVALDPLDGDALILLGQHSQREGDIEQAVFYFERAAGLEGFEAGAKIRHAQLLVGQSRYAEALPLLRRAQLLEPRDSVQEYIDQIERVAQAR